MDTLTVEYARCDSLTPYPGNAKKHNIAAIAESLRVNGQYRPLVAQKSTMRVLAGNGTLEAARSLGWDTIAVVLVDADDTTARRIVLADNRTADLGGGYDPDALAALLGECPDLTGTGYSADDLAALVPDFAPAGDDDGVPDLPEPAAVVTRPGDVWQLGPHRVVCGDCRDPGTVEALLGGRRVNVAFTSPPYASQRAYDASSGFRPVPPDQYADWFEAVQASVRSVLAADGSWFVNVKEHSEDGQRHLYVKDLVIAHVRRWGWRFVDELCWTRNAVPGAWPNRFKCGWEPVFHFSAAAAIKFRPGAVATASDSVFAYSPGNPVSATGFVSSRGRARGNHPGMARPSNVLAIGSETRQTGSHPAPFPVALPAWFIRAYSDPGDVVLDPFMGSGSTLAAAHREGRTAYGCEISPAYCDVVCRRYQELTGTEPLRNPSS